MVTTEDEYDERLVEHLCIEQVWPCLLVYTEVLKTTENVWQVWQSLVNQELTLPYLDRRCGRCGRCGIATC